MYKIISEDKIYVLITLQIYAEMKSLRQNNRQTESQTDRKTENYKSIDNCKYIM